MKNGKIVRSMYSKMKTTALLLVVAMMLNSCSLIDLSSSSSSNGGSNSGTASSTTTTKTDGDKVIDGDVEDKADAIQSIIDEYFYFDSDESVMTESVYKGLMEGLDDPYSVYYTPEEYAKLQESTSGEYVGIGVQVQRDPDTGLITMIKPFKGGPAADAGILKGDVLVGVDDLDLLNSDMELSEVVKLIKGEEGSIVKVTVEREGEAEPLTFEVIRRTVDNPTVEYEMLDNNIGYISIAEFYEKTAEQYIAAVKDLESQGMKGLIVDVRDNPGGLLASVVDILDFMLPEGKIVYTKDKNGNILEEYNSTDKESFDLPMVVLANENSASAAEIYTGALKDYKMATIVGQNTFGKGIVQRLFPLQDGSCVKLTISKYFTPNGNDIHKVGIAPDIEVELPDELKKEIEVEKSQDTQLQAAIKNVTEQMNK